MRYPALVFLSILCVVLPASANQQDPLGAAVPGYGPTRAVPGAAIPPSQQFRVAFDVSVGADKGTLNRRIESAARFLNMHAAAGVPLENIELAVVVHGTASLDLTTDERYGGANANAGLVAALQKAGVRVIMCGQSAAARGISADDLLPGVELALSAMTAHALLQQAGYTLNPF